MEAETQDGKLRLTPKRRRVLECLSKFHTADGAPDHHRIAVLCGKDYCAADWAHGPLRDLLNAGYAEIVGKGFTGRLWRITDTGRAALREN